MPKWGLTVEQRETRPWGIPPEYLLPAKTITDPVHGDIHVTKLEALLIDSPPMQRLRGVRQLGTSHLVYPSASHSRFSHSLGTLRAAQDLLDAVVDSASGTRRPKDHLLAEWEHAGTFDWEWARATVLIRAGALLHDLCHVPFGHTIEDDLGVLPAHDGNAPRFERLWRLMDAEARRVLDAGPGLMRELRALILSKESPGEWHSEYPFAADVVGNTICADLMDYLRRDHQAAGLPMSVGMRFTNDFYIAPSTHQLNARKMVIKIDRDGHIRADIVSEITKYLRYRYEESERVLFHHAKVAADAMIGKLLEMWTDSLWVDHAAQYFPGLVVEHARDLEALRKAVADEAPTHELEAAANAHGVRYVRPPENSGTSTSADLVQELVVADLELQFTRRSDDGLLEYLREYGAGRASTDKRIAAINRLATQVLDRRLFKIIGRAEDEAAQSNADDLYKRFGTAERRRLAEMKAAAMAAVEPSWNAVIWLPAPAMRFKAADVLVDKRGSIAALRKIKEGAAAKDLVTAHQQLWSLNVFASEHIAKNSKQAEEFLSALSQEMTVAFTTLDGLSVPPLDELLLNRVMEAGSLAGEARPTLRAILDGRVAARGGGTTFQERAADLYDAAQQQDIIPADRQRPSRI